MKLQRLAKELKSSASADSVTEEEYDLKIDNSLIESLVNLSQTLSDIKRSNENPLKSIPRQDNSMFILMPVISEILERMENNPI